MCGTDIEITRREEERACARDTHTHTHTHTHTLDTCVY